MEIKKRTYGSDKKSALEAKMSAQKIAWAPIMFQAARALIDLKVLEELLEKKEASMQELAEACNISVYGAKVLLEAALGMELVWAKDGIFKLTKTGYFMLRDELTRANMNFTYDVNYDGFKFLKESIVNGKPEGLKVFGEWDTIYEGLSQLPKRVQKSWFEFDHYYSDNAFPAALPIVYREPIGKLLDIGGNTGKWAIASLRHDANVEVSLMDLPGQLNVAKANLKKEGLDNRAQFLEANVLKEIPDVKGYDAVWMSQFLDCFSEEEVLTILNNVKHAIKPEGRIYILENYWDDQEYEGAAYSLHATSLYFTCMANGNSKMYYSEDMKAQVYKAGLIIDKEYHDVGGVGHTLYECKLK